MSERVYFDCYASYGPHPGKHLEERWTLQHLLEDLDLGGIAGALVFHHQSFHYDNMVGNLRLVDEIREYRDRLFPCWYASPSVSGDFPDVSTFIGEMRKHDVRAIRIDPHDTGVPFKERVWGDLRDALLEQGTLILIEGDRSMPMQPIDDILSMFPENPTLLVRHSWGQWRYVECLMDEYRNMHIEFSSFQANRAIEYFAAKYGAERCLFGTELLAKAPGAARGFLDWTLLGEEDAAKIAAGNLRRLLGGVGPRAAPAPGEWHDELTKAARAGVEMPCEIYDNHCHMLHEGGSSGGRSVVMVNGGPDGMIELIRRVGIDKTAIMSWAGPVSIDADVGNRAVEDAVKKYPDEFIGLSTVNPEHQSEEEIDEVIRKFHIELGYPGLKTLVGGLTVNYDDPLFDKWYSFANEHHLYAVIDPVGSTDDGLIDSLVEKYPNMGISLDHCGQSWHYAKWAARMAKKHDKVFAQMNFTAVTNGTIEYIVEYAGADKVMFGTDSPMRDPRPQVGWLVFTRLPEEDKRKIFGLNFKAELAKCWPNGRGV